MRTKNDGWGTLHFGAQGTLLVGEAWGYHNPCEEDAPTAAEPQDSSFAPPQEQESESPPISEAEKEPADD